MQFENIVECVEKGCSEVADGINGFCLKHSSKEKGFEALRESRAHLCNCGSHLGYYNPWGFAICDDSMETVALIEPGNDVSVTCRTCGSITDITVIQAVLPPMPLQTLPEIVPASVLEWKRLKAQISTL